jgi:hypothetical protein
MIKKSRSTAVVLLTIIFLLLPASHSIAKSLKSLTIYEKVQLNDAVLEPGEYKVEVLQNGGATEVAIYKDKKLVVKAQAKELQQNKKVEKSSVLYLLNGEDTPLISELRLAGESVSYQFDSASQLTKKKSSKNT